MSVRGYKKGKIVLFKKLDIATNLWREYGDTIVMYINVEHTIIIENLSISINC